MKLNKKQEAIIWVAGILISIIIGFGVHFFNHQWEIYVRSEPPYYPQKLGAFLASFIAPVLIISSLFIMSFRSEKIDPRVKKFLFSILYGILAVIFIFILVRVASEYISNLPKKIISYNQNPFSELRKNKTKKTLKISDLKDSGSATPAPSRFKLLEGSLKEEPSEKRDTDLYRKTE